MSTTLVNWAATFQCTPERYCEPTSTAEVQELVRRVQRAGGVLRVIGAGHSPNDSAMCSGPGSTVLSLARMGAITSVDAASGLVTCGGGATLHALNAALHAAGLALPVLGSISDQTIAGAIATGTHGTGLQHGALATSIVGMELVTGAGEVLQPTGEALRCALCSLGVLGVITQVTLRAVPAFDLRVEEGPAAWDEVLGSLAARAASAPFYRFWWIPHTERIWEWRATPVAPLQQPAGGAGGGGGAPGPPGAAPGGVQGLVLGHGRGLPRPAGAAGPGAGSALASAAHQCPLCLPLL